MPDLLCLQKWVLLMSNRSSTFWKHSFTAHVTLLAESMCSIPHSCPTSCLHPGSRLTAGMPLLQDSQTCSVPETSPCRKKQAAYCKNSSEARRKMLSTIIFLPFVKWESVFPLWARRRTYTLSNPHENNPFSYLGPQIS